MDKKPILFTESEAELIAPAYIVFGFESREKFKIVVEMILKDIWYISSRGSSHFDAGVIKQIGKLDYPRELVLWVLMKYLTGQIL